jgi:Type II secretory pathway, prepilin signal peptidase PulO and related peptidases
MTALFYGYVILLGLALGSFVGLAIVRLAEGESVVAPRSRCRNCSHQLSWYENIPVFSFLFLKGRCRNCGHSISWFYPAVELISAAIVTLAFAKLQPWPRFLLYLIPFIVPVLILGFIDMRSLLLPDVLTLPGIGLGFIVHWVDVRYFVGGSGVSMLAVLLDSALGVLAGGGSLFLLGWIYQRLRGREGMGGGDIKYAAMLGAFFGWKAVFFIFLLAGSLGVLIGILLILSGKNTRSSYLPFGSFLSAAALLFLLWGTPLLTYYLRGIHQLTKII